MALPTINTANLAQAVQQSQFTPSTNSGQSEIFCKFDYQTGDYLLGKEADNIAGEEVIIHTDSIAIGWVCWSGGKPHKQLVSFTEQLPMRPEPIGSDDFVEARAIMFKTENDEQAILEGNSYGIRKGIDDLILSIKARAMDAANANYLYPKVVLNSNNYRAQQGNIIHNIQLDIVSWHDVDGNIQPDVKAVENLPEAEAEAAPKRRRRRAA